MPPELPDPRQPPPSSAEPAASRSGPDASAGADYTAHDWETLYGYSPALHAEERHAALDALLAADPALAELGHALQSELDAKIAGAGSEALLRDIAMRCTAQLTQLTAGLVQLNAALLNLRTHLDRDEGGSLD